MFRLGLSHTKAVFPPELFARLETDSSDLEERASWIMGALIGLRAIIHRVSGDDNARAMWRTADEAIIEAEVEP